MLTIHNVKHKGWITGTQQETISIDFYELFADEDTDLPSDPYHFSTPTQKYKIDTGSLAYIISTGDVYMMKSDGTWVLQ